MANRTCDVVVIGGGPGGYVCSIRLGQLKQKVICVEKEEVGGVCLNWGCVPSKALIAASHTYEKVKDHGATMGIMSKGLEVDSNKMQDWKAGIVKKLTGGVRGLFKGNGVELVMGNARVTGPRTVEVKNAEGATEIIEATKAIVIATGSSTIEIPTFKFDGKQIIGAREAVSLREVPKRLLVIGGGVIGLELGMVYQSFGAELTVVELTPSLLPGVDPECVKVVETKLTKRGGKVRKNTRAERLEKSASGVTVVVSSEGKEEKIEADVVLVAVGMKPRSRGIGLEEIGVEIDQRGFVKTNEFCETNIKGVFAIGDVSGQPMLAHKASKEGEVAAEVIAGKHAGKDWVTVPGIIFTDPEIATVGLTEEQAKAQGHTFKVGKFPFAALGRAVCIGETDGFVKVVTDTASGRILGIHIVGPSASDLISEAALALEVVATAEDMALTIHPHPTLSETTREAALAVLGRAIHF